MSLPFLKSHSDGLVPTTTSENLTIRAKGDRTSPNAQPGADEFLVLKSHSLTVLSPLPLARVLPSGLKATELTQFECPQKDQSLALKLQTLMVLSPLPLARSLSIR